MAGHKIYALFFAIIALGVLAIYFVAAGYYPIAIVNGNFITAETFAKTYETTSFYYRNVLKSYDSINATGSLSILKSEEIQQYVLDGLIENVLVDGGTRKEIGNDLDRLIDEKINQAAGTAETDEATRAIYGLKLDDFKNDILAPQAERDILTGALLLKGEKMDSWLSEAKKSANVIIFSSEFSWDGEKVVRK